MKTFAQLLEFSKGGGGGAAPGIATSPPPAPPSMSTAAVQQEQIQQRQQALKKQGINSTIPGMLGGDFGKGSAADPNASTGKTMFGTKNSLLGGG